jgi:hypothetical protein
MNRFRTKKKAKEEGTGGGLGSRFLRGKKAQEEAKPELNLNTALPAQDDFRTSLLMSGLSARFSLLREQDDPSTKIGKASDDSVLFANRQSRLLDFGFSRGPLADISEVDSIKAPPSFARMDSYASDDGGSVSGSMMSRGKPTDGNNLFGGRQKIYKITDGQQGGGKILYGDDVATSAFQKWRQAEKAQQTQSSKLGDESEVLRPESPVSGSYSRKRETSSTSSSNHSLGRNSTAATSVTSQPPSTFKDWQSASATSAASGTGLDRSFTRTRRLYEQGLSNDLQEQQSSALSRFDTLSRRNIGSRTPDTMNNSPSPTTASGGFSERFGFGSDRRPMLGKASAPNLRSFSPPTTSGSSTGATDLGIQVPSASESKMGFAGSPPLSPPISDGGGDHPVLPIQPNDRGKATAMGVFSKPNHGYDDSRYAQRQLQLQQGRETPTQRFRTGSDVSAMSSSNRSRSSSSMQRQAAPAVNTGFEGLKFTQPTVPEEPRMPASFLDDSDTSPMPPSSSKFVADPEPLLRRPSDSDHPALRQESALPTPLSLDRVVHGLDDPSPISDVPELRPTKDSSHQVSPEDSPTLGPGPAGLSGLVRQHLRNDSGASSIYGPVPHTAGLDAPPVPSLDDRSSYVDSIGTKSNPWSLHQDQDWAHAQHTSFMSSPTKTVQSSRTSAAPSVSADAIRNAAPSSKAASRSSREPEEGDGAEFANQLANARRRVRERLTSYVETDASRESSPSRFPDLAEEQSNNVPPMPASRSNSTGVGILKPKSSRGSLADRARDHGQSKALKMLGIGGTSSSGAPSPIYGHPYEETTTAAAAEEPAMESTTVESRPGNTDSSDADIKSLKGEENMHPGLRAFRHAKRQLQRNKELETLARHHGQRDEAERQQAADSKDERPLAGEQPGRGPNKGRKAPPPPISYQPRASSQESKHSNSSGERGRSGSDASNEPSSYGRPGRMRNGSTPRDEHAHAQHQYHEQPAYNNSSSSLVPPPRPGMLRSPGLPGTDIRNSPIMPPQGHSPNGLVPSPRYFDRQNSNNSLQPARTMFSDTSSGQPSPMSPLPPGQSPFLGLPSSPMPSSANGSGAATPTGHMPSPRRPSAPSNPSASVTASTMNESLKRVVRKGDISEPTFIMSTSRVPTVALPAGRTSDELADRQRSRSASRGRADANGISPTFAPPLPPINPMRRQDTSRVRAADNSSNTLGVRGYDEMASVSSPHLPLVKGPQGANEDTGVRSSSFSISDDEDRPNRERRRLRKQSIDAKGGRPNLPVGRPTPGQNPFVATGPPVSRSIITPIKNGPGSGMPGGMF